MRKRLVIGWLLATVLVLLIATPAFAQGNGPGKLILGGQFTLRSGETLSGDLGVIGGSATLEEDSVVNGDVLVTGGTLRVSGTINGDVAMFGGFLELTGTAVVDGDVFSFGGTMQRADGARITGDVVEGGEFSFPGWRGLPRPPQVPAPQPPTLRTSPGDWLLLQLLRIIRAIGLTLALAALALVVSMFWPRGIELIGSTVLEQPVLAFAVGLLSWFLGVGLVTVLTVTICLIPVAILLGLALVVAAFLAWIAAGWVVGRKLLLLLNVRATTVVLEATLGTLILVMLYFLLGVLPCVDFIFGAVVASLGLGAVILTRFGTQPYTPGGRRVGPSTPPSPVEDVAADAAPRPVAVHSAEELGLPRAAAEAASRGQEPEIRGKAGTPTPLDTDD